MNDRQIEIGAVRLHVRDYEHDGETIVFLHFGGGNLMVWQGIVPYFEGQYRLLLFDLKGHGKSDKPATGYHVDQLADEVVAVLDVLGVAQAHVVGSSLGAEVGLSLAANHPARVQSLVCDGALFSQAGPYGLWEGSDAEFEAHAAQKLETLRNRTPKRYRSIDALVADARAGFEAMGWWSDLHEAVVRYDAIETDDGQYQKSWGIIVADYYQHYLFQRVEDYYRRVQCPLLLLPDTYPGQDEREKAVMQALAELVDDVRIEYVPEWVHPFGWVLTPEPVSKAVLAFLAAAGG